jgi:autotransporter-associated beta strand protein
MDAGGVTIDTGDYNVGVAQSIYDYAGGGLTKTGSGTLTLTGANSYTGSTIVNAGKLMVGTSSTGNGDYNVADTAGFGVVYQSAGAQLNVNNLTLGGATGGDLNFDLGSVGNPAAAPLNVLGTLTANGSITINVAASVISVGTIPLLTYGTWSGGANFTLGSLPTGVIASLATNGNTIELVVSSAGLPRWDGAVLGQWDLGTNQDWYDLGQLQTTAYADGKPVLFNDDAAGTTAVNLTATVSPASINFNNNALPYTVYGTGKITGGIGLNVNGTAGVSMLNTGGDDFTGPVSINAGVLTVTNLANGGSPSPLGASSSDPTNLVINAGTLTYAGSPVAVNRGFTVGSTNSTIDTEGSLTLGGRISALTNALTGGSGFTKTGPGQLTIAATGFNDLSHGYKPGLHADNGTLVFDGSAGGQTNHCESEFWIGDTNGWGASVVLTNATLVSDSWLGMGRSGGINTTSSLALYNATYQMGACSLGYDAGVPGYQGTQVLSLGGNSVFTNRGDMNLAESPGATVAIDVSGNSVLYSQNRALLCMGNGNTGTMTVAGNGKAIINGWFSVGDAANANASLLLKDSAAVNVSVDLNVTDVGLNCTSIVTVADSAQINANNIYVGKDTGVSATLTITNNAAVMSTNGLTMATYYDHGARIPNVAVVNLAGGSLGVNLVQGSVTNSVNYGDFNFNGGKLMIHGPYFGGHDVMFNLASANILSGGATIEVDNTDSAQISQPLLGGNNDGGLTKTGTGTLYLNGANTYTNTTRVNAGSLGGSGTILGPVTVASGATLVGDSGTVGASLVINNALTLSAGSTTYMNVTPSSNDQITGLTQVNYGGSLVVSNTSASPLTDGQTFVLFNASTAGTGNYSSVSVLPAGLFTGTFDSATGILTIHAAPPAVVINPPTLSGGNIIMTGSGKPGDGYTWLSTTNLTPPVVWTTNSQGTFDSSGVCTNSYMVTNPPHLFFRLRSP